MSESAPRRSVEDLPQRLAALDIYRGLVMFLMMAEVLHLNRVEQALPTSDFWRFLAAAQTHETWRGCTLHDLIQPSFSFLVGAALPFSLARRRDAGEAWWASWLHAGARAIILILLGVVLRSFGREQTNWTFEDTLTQIGLGYFFLFAIAHAPAWAQWSAFGAIVVGYWAAFALYPVPGLDFDWKAVHEGPASITQFSGFAGHWGKNTNLAWAFDTWFLNLFPREQPFLFNGGGYATLSFIPTLATMILGLLAGNVLRAESPPWQKLRWLLAVGVGALLLAAALDEAGICPIVKRIWTPSWVLWSGAFCLFFTAGFYGIADLLQWRDWGFFFTVIGMNSVAAYLLAHGGDAFFLAALPRHLGSSLFDVAGEAYRPLLLGGGVLLCQWLVLWGMYRQRIFVRI